MTGALASLKPATMAPAPATDIINKKLERQFVESFKITEQIEHLTYCLDLSPNGLNHDVISIAHLKPAHTNDLYNRPQPANPPTVTVDEAMTNDHYEIEGLFQKGVSRQGGEVCTQYLIRGKGYGPEFDTGYNVKDLGNDEELVKKYEDGIAEGQEAALP